MTNTDHFKQGLILIYPGYQSEAKQYQYNRIIEEFEKFGVKIDKLKIDNIFFSVQDNKVNLEVNNYDFCIQLVKDKYINALLEKRNIQSFNSYSAIDNCDDKMMTYTLLSNHGIKMPTSISGNMNDGIESIENNTTSNDIQDYVEKKLGYPFIIKKLNSKGGRDIYKINDRNMLNEICDKLINKQYLFQQFISSNQGKDIRVVVVGGNVVGGFMRVNENDFRSNISLGGKAIPYTVTSKHREIAEKIAKILKLDYCSVDFFLTNDNEEPIICEVNADPALCDIEELSGKNIAKVFAEYIIDKVYNI